MRTASHQYHSGQATTEFIVILALLTSLGAFIFLKMVGQNHKSGAIGAFGAQAKEKIARDGEQN